MWNTVVQTLTLPSGLYAHSQACIPHTNVYLYRHLDIQRYSKKKDKVNQTRC